MVHRCVESPQSAGDPALASGLPRLRLGSLLRASARSEHREAQVLEKEEKRGSRLACVTWGDSSLWGPRHTSSSSQWLAKGAASLLGSLLLSPQRFVSRET